MRKRQKPFNLILLGDPASGKGTQAAMLARKYHMYDFDMGKELRKAQNRRKHDFSGTTGRGKLTPTWLAREIQHQKVRTTPSHTGIIFNGTPKMVGEARLVARWLKESNREDPLFVYLRIPLGEIYKRVQRGRMYAGEGKKVFREDDSARALKNRFVYRTAYYRTQIPRVVSFFKRRYVFKKISGVGSRKQVFRRIVAFIEAKRAK